MRRSTTRNTVAIIGIGVVAAFALAGPATAGRSGGRSRWARPAVTKMTLKLDERSVTVGEDVTGSVVLRARSGKRWTPLADAPLRVWVNKVEVGSVTTDGDGRAEVSYTTEAPGEYALRVTYAGSSTTKRAQRTQGFEVVEPAPEEPPVEEDPVEEDPVE